MHIIAIMNVMTTIRGNGVSIKEYLVAHFQAEHPQKREQADRKTENTATAKDVHRFCCGAIEKFNDQQIQKHFDHSFEPILRIAGSAGLMIHDHFADFRAVPGSVDREEPVHLAVQPNAFDHMPFVRFQRTAKIMKRNAGDQRRSAYWPGYLGHFA